jgi:hypothetical protein
MTRRTWPDATTQRAQAALFGGLYDDEPVPAAQLAAILAALARLVVRVTPAAPPATPR